MKLYEGSMELVLRVNGEERRVAARPETSLLRLLREGLGLTGTKCGCENGDCGACTVRLDGRPVKSCMVLAAECEGLEILTVEGLRGHPVQAAFRETDGFQCGFCTPGQLMAASALVDRAREEGRRPGAEEVREWMEGNLCRCTGYEGISRALARAFELAGL